ncbi:MAG: thioredoxin fold domain-containing protein [Burkholderiales bacterium]|nr:thioredoxin fold domain-containing protein [Burkholderiales bacterium]
MSLVRRLMLALMLALAAPAYAADAPAARTRGVPYTLPHWFKASFLDFRDELRDARNRKRHVMVFLHLDECPYCERMLRENFTAGDNRRFMEQHFDVIAVNVRGDLDLVWSDGAAYTERTLARHLNAFATPTLVFLGHDGKVVLKLTGYRDQRALRESLEYVQSERYRREP